MGEMKAANVETCLIFFEACATIRASMRVCCILHCQNLPLHRQHVEMDHTTKVQLNVYASGIQMPTPMCILSVHALADKE